MAQTLCALCALAARSAARSLANMALGRANSEQASGEKSARARERAQPAARAAKVRTESAHSRARAGVESQWEPRRPSWGFGALPRPTTTRPRRATADVELKLEPARRRRPAAAGAHSRPGDVVTAGARDLPRRLLEPQAGLLAAFAAATNAVDCSLAAHQRRRLPANAVSFASLFR